MLPSRDTLIVRQPIGNCNSLRLFLEEAITSRNGRLLAGFWLCYELSQFRPTALSVYREIHRKRNCTKSKFNGKLTGCDAMLRNDNPIHNSK